MLCRVRLGDALGHDQMMTRPGAPQHLAGAPFSVPAPQVRLNAAGYGYTTVTCPGGVSWEIWATSVSTTEASLTVNPPTVKIYRGTEPSPAQFIENTFAGNGATSDTKHRLDPGQALTAEWTGGTPNTVATLRVSGLQHTAF